MSRRVVFQNFVEEHAIHSEASSAPPSPREIDDTNLHQRGEGEEKEEDHVEALRKSIQQQQTLEQRRQRRRRKAYGSAPWRYINIRLQLRVLTNSSRKVVILVLGALALIGLWVFFVFGRPDSPGFWLDIDTRWGGSLNDNSSILCEASKLNAFTRQPAGGLATASYAVVGWFMIYMWFLDERFNLTFEARFGNLPASLVVRRTLWSFLLGMSLWFLATVSWLRHATVSNTGKRLETTGYWSVLFAFSVCAVTRMVDPPKKLRSLDWTTMSKTISFIMIFTTVGVDVAFGIRLETLKQAGVPEIVFGTLAGLSLLSCILHWRMHRLSIESEVWLLFIGIMFFVAGFLLAHFENTMCLNGGKVFLQPYAIWHVTNSLAAFFFYLYLRSDLWVKGDGAEFAPRIRPILWTKWVILGAFDYIKEILKGAHPTNPAKKEAKITLMRDQPLRGGDDETEEGEQQASGAVSQPQSNNNASPTSVTRRLAQTRSARSIQSMWTPELGFSKKQIRVAEFFCGVVITGFVIYVIYLALARPS